MIFHKAGKSGGFIKTIVLIVIALIILGYFGYSIEDIINSPTVERNLNYAWDWVKYVWDNYLKVPIIFVWEKIIIGLGWNNLVKIIKNNNNNVPIDVSGMAP